MFIKMRWQEIVLRAGQYLLTRYEWFLRREEIRLKLLFAASKCHVTIQRGGSSRCSKWPNRMEWLQWWNIAESFYKEEEAAEKDD